MDAVCPDARLDPGADWGMNSGRLFVPAGLGVHTTEGRDSRGLGKNRHHATPGTFGYLIHAGELICYYPDNVRTSTMAGGNYTFTHVEIDMFTGEALQPADAAALGKLARYHSQRWGWTLADYQTGDPRVWFDQNRAAGRGARAHRKCDYPPDRSLNHYDEVRVGEWSSAIGNAGSAPEEDEMKGVIVVAAGGDGKWWWCRGWVRSWITDPYTAGQLNFLGMSTNSTPAEVHADFLNQFLDVGELKMGDANFGDVKVDIDYTKMTKAVKDGVNAAETS